MEKHTHTLKQVNICHSHLLFNKPNTEIQAGFEKNVTQKLKDRVSFPANKYNVWLHFISLDIHLTLQVHVKVF